uniref:Uncharacterized protein n=1 Tax=virus sp. ctBM815 TaxID=2825806 RepID=A0A8S5RJU2_9VIRU|nr:MAG TPA: hypothetical protein [virus sp. ctBM815]DAV23846.1 MAG TPA: hypothetical protein [Bacteriophage sp.]
MSKMSGSPGTRFQTRVRYVSAGWISLIPT